MSEINHTKRKAADEILSVGITLPDYGLGWGLDKASALSALLELRQSMIPVLGGDVLILKEGRWVHTYDNWYCDRSPNEPYDDYCLRSNEVTKEYIQKYPTNDDSQVVFVFVPDAQ